MNLRPHRREPVDINLTPLLDVVFLLLIFFMVSTTFKDEARLRVQLPEAQGESLPAQAPEMIRIVIDRAGRFYVNDQALVDEQPSTLTRALTGALGERRQMVPGDAQPPPVLIQADANTLHQAVITAMDAASQAGLNRIAFAATLPASAEAGQPDGAAP
ncbi:biopolymer transporter ExbD [Thiocystis minor]|uniref:ExbD/TolR family protein n=1 Tax=Thiocystis minor TaxID=61597 RepID=UPI0019136B27|nr:biopolymer transporter ExbD [Thiocystis minor]MBK5965062.1 biopolymer transporter ExbD [Thiocystis minor]